LVAIHGGGNNGTVTSRTRLTVLANEGHGIATEIFCPAVPIENRQNQTITAITMENLKYFIDHPFKGERAEATLPLQVTLLREIVTVEKLPYVVDYLIH